MQEEKKQRNNSARLQKIHAEILSDLANMKDAVFYERKQCVEDRLFVFVAGQQWASPGFEKFENKPKIEVNKVLLGIVRIINEYVNLMIDVVYSSKKGKSYDKAAELMNGLYRAAANETVAEEADRNAFEEGCSGGIGAIRFRNVYEDEFDEENEKQKIVIEPIYEADSCVFFNSGAKRKDKSDATRCIVMHSVDEQDFLDEYGFEPSSLPNELSYEYFEWSRKNSIFVGEYYKKETVSVTFNIYEGIGGEEKKVKAEDVDEETEEGAELAAFLYATGYKLKKTRKIKEYKVRKYLFDGSVILEDCGYIAGQNIPIVPYYGKRWFVNNIERCQGYVRITKDTARLANMVRSSIAQIASVSPVEKPIFYPEQISGVGDIWEKADDYNALVINPIIDSNGQKVITGPVGFTKAPEIPPALAAMVQICEQDLKDLMGNAGAAEEIRSNLSGRAVELIQNKIDMQSYIYIENMRDCKKRCGEVFLSMAKEIYSDPGRLVKILDKSGAVKYEELNSAALLDDDDDLYANNDLSKADLEVTAIIGAKSSSTRAATVKAITGMMTLTQDQETLQLLTAMAMMNIEGDGLSDINEYFREKLVKIGAIKPTEEELMQLDAESKNSTQDPNSEYLQAAARQADAEAAKARADTILTISKSEETKAKTIKTLSEIDEEKENRFDKSIIDFNNALTQTRSAEEQKL